MTQIESIQAPIAAELASYGEQFKASLQHENPLLQKALDHILQRRGKLIRPTLVFLAARMFGEVNQKVYDVALSLELLHTASLVHDDVVDESDKRRGQASVNSFLTNQIAVLVGDFILSRALHHAAATGDPQVVDTVASLGQTLADGELLQIQNLDSDRLSDVVYYNIIGRKTASLFSTCGRLGVLVSGGTNEEAERMASYGKLVGMCFQLRDDVFDYGTSDEVGKPVGNDMKEGKLTLPVIHAINKTKNETMLQKALMVRRGEASQQDIHELVDFTIANGGLDYARWSMDEFRMMADGLVDEKRDPAIAESLHLFVNFVADRTF